MVCTVGGQPRRCKPDPTPTPVQPNVLCILPQDSPENQPLKSKKPGLFDSDSDDDPFPAPKHKNAPRPRHLTELSCATPQDSPAAVHAPAPSAKPNAPSDSDDEGHPMNTPSAPLTMADLKGPAPSSVKAPVFAGSAPGMTRGQIKPKGLFDSDSDSDSDDNPHVQHAATAPSAVSLVCPNAAPPVSPDQPRFAEPSHEAPDRKPEVY